MGEIEDKSKVQKEIISVLPTPCHGLLNLAPRVGKTKIGIDIIKKEKPKKILWVTPSTQLRDVDIPLEFKTWRAITYLKKTDIICYASMASHKGAYDLVILDEYQDITDSNVRPFLNGSIKFNNIIGLSGTHPKHEEKLDIYKKLKLEILVSMTIDEAVGKGLIAPYEIIVIECELEKIKKTIKAGSKAKPFMNTENNQYAYFNRSIAKKIFLEQPVPQFYYLNRMRFIYNLQSKTDFAKKLLFKLKGRTLLFAGSIKQAEELCKYTYHSKTDDKDYKSFKEEKINQLACVNSGGLGNTYKNVDNFIIVQVNSNKKGDATQKIARSLVLQKGYKAKIFILSVINTSDEKWKDEVLKDFNEENVKHVNYKEYGKN